jgi:prephenate dehydrogenase
MKVYVIGLGLIGGSLALDIKRESPDTEILGIDANEQHIEEAIKLGIVGNSATIEDLANADWVIVAVPVNTIALLLPQVLDKIGDNTIVFDVGSTKAAICKAAMHPIAGTEFSGPSAAITGLFTGKTNIICEVEKTAFKLQERALTLFNTLGMRIRYMDAVSHDMHIAYVSHLSHISSFMLGKTVIEKEKDERDIFDMAGSGFASTVRLAKSSPATWAAIFRENKTNVGLALQQYIANLQTFQELLEREDYEGIYNEMENTNRIKNILDGIS